MTKEDDEWAKASRAGSARRRPLFIAGAAGAAVVALSFGAMALYLDHEQDRADRGEVVYEHRDPRTAIAALVFPVALGFATFRLVSRRLGGPS